MAQPTARTGWLGAVAAWAMMLGVQWLHAPLSHGLTCQDHACAEPPEQPFGHACGHAHAAAPARTETDHDDEDHQPFHSDDCSLCQFLTQPADPPAVPLGFRGCEIVSAAAVTPSPGCPGMRLPRPHVRGPPMGT